jgi:hypothetical protein
VELIGNSHILAMDLIVAGFPCQGCSCASSQARGLNDLKTHLFVESRLSTPYHSLGTRVVEVTAGRLLRMLAQLFTLLTVYAGTLTKS